MSDEKQPALAPDGQLDAFMSRIFGRSWRTSCTGLASLVVGLLAVLPGVPEGLQEGARIAAPILAGSGLMLAKDSRISGLPR